MPGTKAYNLAKPKILLISFIFLISLFSSIKTAQSQEPSERLFSETIGLQFYNIANEIHKKQTLPNAEPTAFSETVDISELNQAALFLYAATQVDNGAEYVLPDMLNIASHLAKSEQENLTSITVLPDSLTLVGQLLISYADSNSDFLVLRNALQNAMYQLNSRQEREQYIQGLLASGLREKNNRFDSYLLTQLGIYAAEKNDLQTAANYLIEAYNLYNYNNLAFSKLSEIIPDQIQPQMYLKQLRLKLIENPFDLPVALDLARYAEKLELYDLSASTYTYCSDLFSYLYPTQQLPSSIYLPRVLSFYNTERNPYKAVQIADTILTERFDLMLASIALKAAQKINDRQKANQLLETAEEAAMRQYKQNSTPEMATRIAWFYSFAHTQSLQALDWANKAYSKDPNSVSAASLLALNLVENGQIELAQTLLDSYPDNQIADITRAKIAIEKGDPEAAIEHLNLAIKKDPASLEAESAIQLLETQGGEYLPAVDASLIYETLKSDLNTSLEPQFVTPENIISVTFNSKGSKFPYGIALNGYVVITNNHSQPIIISDSSLFQGNIRIDAEISGDINTKIPNLINKRVVPSSPIKPNRNFLIPVHLSTGNLRNILQTYPQASLDIKLNAYIDPVINTRGEVTNNLREIEPATLTVSRPGINLTRRYLQNRLDSMTTGRQGQRIQTAELLVGLLEEQQAMTKNQPLYKFMSAEWMPELLRSAITKSLSDNDWITKTNTMGKMLSLSLDYNLTNAVAENLNDPRWPARLMALYLLAKDQGPNFSKVLDWHAEYDPQIIVRDMAVALGAKRAKSQIAPEPPQQATPQNLPLDNYIEDILRRSRRIEPQDTRDSQSGQ